jgi:hypothetical protein
VTHLGLVGATELAWIGRRGARTTDPLFSLIEHAWQDAILHDALDDDARLGIHLDELDTHSRGVVRVGFVLLTPPNHTTDAVDQRRLVLEQELEFEQCPHRQRLLGLDEYASSRDIVAVAFDEILERGALVADLQRKQRAPVFACVCH